MSAQTKWLSLFISAMAFLCLGAWWATRPQMVSPQEYIEGLSPEERLRLEEGVHVQDDKVVTLPDGRKVVSIKRVLPKAFKVPEKECSFQKADSFAFVYFHQVNKGDWEVKRKRELVPGEEFFPVHSQYKHDELHVMGENGELLHKPGRISRAETFKALHHYEKKNRPKVPKLTDVVRVIQTKEQAPGLWRLQDVWESPAKYWYNGFLFELVRLDERHTRSKYLGIVAGKVIKTMSHHEPKTTLKSTVVYADGSQGEFRSTPDHRFYVPSLDEYVGMQGVPEGEEFETADGQRALLLRKDVESISQEYFNLTVADAHNYYVMPDTEQDANSCGMWDPDKAVLVHNDNCPTGLLGTDQITDPRRLLAGGPFARPPPPLGQPITNPRRLLPPASSSPPSPNVAITSPNRLLPPTVAEVRTNLLGAFLRGVRVAQARVTSIFRARLRREAGFEESGRPLILDENLQSRGMAEGLRERGHNVRSIQEIYGQRGILDEDIYDLARTLDARVITRDRGRQADGGFQDLGIQIDRRVRSVDGVDAIIRAQDN